VSPPGQALVIGAGIGGLACALGLQRAGWSVRIHEKFAELREVGAGLTVSPNAARALEWLGVFESLRSRFTFPPYQIMEDPISGAEIGRLVRGPLTLEQYGAPYVFIHRADLHAGLAAAVRERDSDAIVLGRECVAVRSDEVRPVAVFADGSEVGADVLIGCDGIRSGVRAALYGDAMPRYTGFVAWRALIPYENASAAALPAGSAIDFGPGRCVVRYRLDARRLLNIAAFARRAEWTEESWTVPADPLELRALFADWHVGIRDALGAVREGELYRWGLFDRDPTNGYVRGAVALLGDASHPMLPFLGQGAALALEDAVVLARALASCPSIPEALARYAALRQPRGAEAVLESRAAGARLHGEGQDPRTRNEETLDYFRYDPATVAL
jgi:salicylate hydroxylase